MKFAQRFWAAKVSVFAEDIRRNDKGRRCIRRVVQKACDLDTQHFPDNPTFDLATRECSLKGLTKFTSQDLVHYAPSFFQYVNFNCRNAEAYGQRVYDCLHKIITDLRKDPPCRKSFQDFVTDMHSAKLGGKINL